MAIVEEDFSDWFPVELLWSIAKGGAGSIEEDPYSPDPYE